MCGADVFFYQSPSGGRVFFDELGPPWPKHPCTDTTSVPVLRPRPVLLAYRTQDADRRPAWQRRGWKPTQIRSSEWIGGSHAVYCDGVGFVYVDEALRVSGPTVASIEPWDPSGWSVISYVELDTDEVPKQIAVRRKPIASFPTAVYLRRRREAEEQKEQAARAREARIAEKERIVAEAELLSGSTDWDAASLRFRALRQRWSATKKIKKAFEDELARRLRTAEDAFFAARANARRAK